MVNIQLIEYCFTNMEQGVLEAINELQTLYPQAKIQAWGCLGHCYECFREPFVYVNEQLILAASTPAELIQLVQKTAAE